MTTLMMVKPDVVEAGRYGEIIELTLRNKFKIKRLQMLALDRSAAQRFYEVHREKSFFADLVDYMTSGPVVAMEIEGGGDVVERIRAFIGPTNPAEAAPGTLRHVYGKSIQYNAVHASDSPESAKKELAIVFSGP